MKVLYLLLLFVALAAARGPRCPSKDGRKAVLLPNPKSCSSFYICSNGKPIKQYCPAGLQFNPILKVCDWPNRSFCSRRADFVQDEEEIEDREELNSSVELQDTDEIITDSEDIEDANESDFAVARGLKCPSKDGRQAILLPNPKSCSSFYICSNGRPIKQYCPARLEFNPILKVCDWPNRSRCNKRVEFVQGVDEVEDTEEIKASDEKVTDEIEDAEGEDFALGRGLKCPAKDGRKAVLLPNPKSCASFYICSNGRPIKQYCPARLEFNPLLKVCDWPNRSLCFKRV